MHDPRFREWYQLGLLGRRWQKPYQFIQGQVGFDLVQPMLAPDGEVIGACGVSFVLDALDEFLAELMEGDYLDRTIIVIDRDTGYLQANSRVATKLFSRAETDTNDPILTVVSQYYAENNYTKCDGVLHNQLVQNVLDQLRAAADVREHQLVHHRREPAHCPRGKYFTADAALSAREQALRTFTDHDTCELCPDEASCDAGTELFEGLPRLPERGPLSKQGFWLDLPKWHKYKGLGRSSDRIQIKPCPASTCRGEEKLELFELNSDVSSDRALLGLDSNVPGLGFNVSGLDCFSSDRILQHCLKHPELHSPFGCADNVVVDSPLCGVCEPGHYLDRDNGRCRECYWLTQVEGLGYALFVIALILFLVIMTCFVSNVNVIDHEDGTADVDKSYRTLMKQEVLFAAECDPNRKRARRSHGGLFWARPCVATSNKRGHIRYRCERAPWQGSARRRSQSCRQRCRQRPGECTAPTARTRPTGQSRGRRS